MALAVAIVAGLVAAVRSPGWDVGDLLVAVYLAATSLMLWGQSVRINRARSSARFTTTVAVALGVAFAFAVLLVVIDIATRGSL